METPQHTLMVDDLPEEESVTVITSEDHSNSDDGASEEFYHPLSSSSSSAHLSMPPPLLPAPPQISIVREFFNRQRVENGSLYKTRLCIFTQNDRTHLCPDGDRCNFAHSLGELQGRPDLRKTALCKYVKLGSGISTCPRVNCKYAHSLAEMRIDPRYANLSGGGDSRFNLLSSAPHLHTIKRVGVDTFVTTCEFCGKFCRVTPLSPVTQYMFGQFGTPVQPSHSRPQHF